MGWRDGVWTSVLVIMGREPQTITGSISPRSARIMVRPARWPVSPMSTWG
jgi:hypothetical protein